jgi:DeoR family fructose operon transcriptional repressor
VSNESALSLVREMFAEVAFLGSGGLDSQAGLTDYHLDEAVVRRLVIANSRSAWILADSTKFDLVARTRVASFAELSGLISERAPSEGLFRAIHEAGGSILTPDTSNEEIDGLRRYASS